MGTNFYWVQDPCPHCGRGDTIHIGKSSGGWTFMFQGTEEIRSYQDWLKILQSDKGEIIDSYRKQHTLGVLMALIAIKQTSENRTPEVGESDWLDPEGRNTV